MTRYISKAKTVLFCVGLFLSCFLGCTNAQNAEQRDAKALIEAFVNLQDVPQPFAATLAELKAKHDAGQIQGLQQLTENLSKTYFQKDTPDPSAIPYLIALIDADNSYHTVYDVGYFSLWRMTGVEYSVFHDGAFWKRWWEKSKANFPDEFQKITIPELPKTAHGKSHKPYSEKLETLDGLLEYLCEQFTPEGKTFQNSDFWGLADAIVKFKDPKAIPYLIGAIEADNSYATVYGLGYFGLGKLTDVKYNVFHDGAFWKRWWEKNKTNFPEEVQKITIPELPRTAHGKKYQPYPENAETLTGQLLLLQSSVRHAITLSKERKFQTMTPLWGVVQSIAQFNDPTAIPYLIAAIDADNTYDTVYGIGYFGLGFGNPRLTDVKYDESHDGKWWKQWWEENKQHYPEAVQKISIPSIHDEWKIPDLSKEVALWRQEKAEKELREMEAKRREKEEQMFKELAESDVGDVPAERLHVDGNEKMEYFLIGFDKDKPVPESGYRLVVVMPGGDGSADFHPFVRRMWKYAMDESGTASPTKASQYIVAQPIAVRWTPNQQIVWATENAKVEKQEFSTERFVESVVADVAKRVKVDPKSVFTLSWSSSGPAAYAIALQDKTAITGSYILMSVFRPNEYALENAKDRLFAIQHSPEDRVCPFRMAKDAEEQLTKHGAVVKFTEYSGGHGWHGNIYGRIRENLDWLQMSRP